jgi:hypothetical protein
LQASITNPLAPNVLEASTHGVADSDKAEDGKDSQEPKQSESEGNAG